MSVGIIGGGISGLSLANALERYSKYSISLYDTGSRNFGGRASSRKLQGTPVDHAVQFIVAKNPAFQKQVEKWEESGVVQKWSKGVGIFEQKSHTFHSFKDGVNRYIGSNEAGLQSIPNHLASNLQRCKLHRNVWVSPNNGLRYNDDGSWGIWANNREIGRHEIVIIAHNGKCADKITSSNPSRKVNQLLRTSFSDRPFPNKMTLNAIFSLIVELDKNIVCDQFEGAFLPGSSILSWIGCNSSKYSKAGLTSIWTIMSTPSFAKEHKVAQEHLKGTETEQLVFELMITEALKYIRKNTESLGDAKDQVINFKLQLWGAGVPTNVWKSSDQKPFIWDPEFNIGCTGDWLCSPSVEGAWLSGHELGHQLSLHPKQSAGLEGRFVPAGDTSGLGDLGCKSTVRNSSSGHSNQRGRGGFSKVQGRGGSSGGRGRSSTKSVYEQYGTQRRSLGSSRP